MQPAVAGPNPIPAPKPGLSDSNAERGFKKAILRLVKGGPERLAIEAGQIDAIIDPTSGRAILLPEAQRALVEQRTGYRGLIGLAFDWYWEQDERHRFVLHKGSADETSGLEEAGIIGRALWDLSIDNLDEADWRTHRQQLEWRSAFRDLEVRLEDDAGKIWHLSLSGEPIFDARDQFKGYRGITRNIETPKRTEALVQASNRFAHAVLEALGAEVGMLDRSGVVLSANRVWRASSAGRPGMGAGVAEGENYLKACDAAAGDERLDGMAIAAGIRQVIAGERELFRYEHRRDAPGDPRWFALSITGAAGNTPAHVIVSREDITERRRGDLLLALERTVLRSLAGAEDAAGALRSVIRSLCETQEWDCGRYFRLDQAAGVLHFGESWGVPAAAVQQFLERSRGMVFRSDAGFAGRVCQSGQPFWILDDAREATASPTALSPETGEGGAFVLPVTSDDRMVGVLAFSGRGIREPDDRMLQTVKSIGGELGRFLQRQQAVDDLRRSERRFRALNDLTSDWYWEQDSEFRFTQVSGYSPFGSAEALGLRHWDLPHVVLPEARWAELRSRLDARWSFCDFEFAVALPDGKQGYYSISGAALYDDAGAFAGYFGTGLDITERRRAEIALREGQVQQRGAS